MTLPKQIVTDHSETAKAIADAIFSAGAGPLKCNRIQFMGGTWPDNEKPQGGFCHDALKRCIEGELKKRAALSDPFRQRVKC